MLFRLGQASGWSRQFHFFTRVPVSQGQSMRRSERLFSGVRWREKGGLYLYYILPPLVLCVRVGCFIIL